MHWDRSLSYLQGHLELEGLLEISFKYHWKGYRKNIKNLMSEKIHPNLSINEQDICLSIFYDRLPIAIDVSSRTGGWWSLKPRLSHGSTSDFTNTTMWHSKSFVFVFYKHHDLTLKIFCICTLKISRRGHSQTISISCKFFSFVSELLNQKHHLVWMHSIRWMIFMRNRIQ